MRMLLLVLMLTTSSTVYAQTRVTAQEWEPQARQLAMQATGDTTLTAPSGVEPAPAPGDVVLVEWDTGAASGWRYDYAFGDFLDGGSRYVATVTMVEGQQPVMVLPQVSSAPFLVDNLYPLPPGWLDSGAFLQQAADVQFDTWYLAGFKEAYDDAAVIALRAYGGSRGPQNGYVGKWAVEVRSDSCSMRMSVRFWADGLHVDGGGRPAYSNLGDCHPPSVSSEKVPFSGTVSLGSAMPNPFSQTTTIPFTLAIPSAVRLEVFDLLGRVVAMPVNEYMNPGTHSVVWDAQGQPAGVYLCRLIANGVQHTQHMVLVN